MIPHDPAAAPDGEAGNPSISGAWLRTAKALKHTLSPSSDAARSLAANLASRIARDDGKRRAGKRMDALTSAVGAFVGSVVEAACKTPPRPVMQSRKAAAFSGSPVGYRPALDALDGLARLGMVHTVAGKRYALDWGDGGMSSHGLASRWWASASLMDLAASHGITSDTISQHWRDAAPPKAPRVKAPVIVRALQGYRAKQTAPGARAVLPLDILGAALPGITAAVSGVNRFLEGRQVEGCRPPRFVAVYGPSVLLGGRWHAQGTGSYQTMPEGHRLDRLRIDGEQTAELDVSASQLSILMGVMGLVLPKGDPYAVSGVPREVVKAWIVATLGKGSPVKRWSTRARQDTPATARHDAAAVLEAICQVYPVLRDPSGPEVSAALKLDALNGIAPPPRLLALRLQGIEAAALRYAVAEATHAGFVVLPMHDGIIVPRSHVGEAERLLAAGYQGAAKITPRIKMQQA